LSSPAALRSQTFILSRYPERIQLNSCLRSIPAGLPPTIEHVRRPPTPAPLGRKPSFVTARLAIVLSRDSQSIGPMSCAATHEPSRRTASVIVSRSATTKRREDLFLMPHVSRLLLQSQSGNRSRKLPCLRKEDGVARGIAQYRRRRLGKCKDAGHTLETAGSSGDLKGQSTLGK